MNANARNQPPNRPLTPISEEQSITVSQPRRDLQGSARIFQSTQKPSQTPPPIRAPTPTQHPNPLAAPPQLLGRPPALAPATLTAAQSRYVVYCREAAVQTDADGRAASQESLFRAQRELAQTTEALLVSRAELQGARQRLAESETAIAERDELRRALQTAREREANAARLQTENGAQIARATQLLRERDAELQSERQKTERLTAELAAAEQRVAEQTAAKARGESEAAAELACAAQLSREREATLQAERRRAEQSAVDAERRAQAVAADLAAQSENCRQLHARGQALRDEARELAELLRGAEAHAAELESANAAFADRETIFAERLQEAVERLEELGRRNAELESAAVQPLRSQFYALLDESVALETLCESLRAEIAETRRAEREAALRVSELRRERDEAERRAAEANAAFEAETAELHRQIDARGVARPSPTLKDLIIASAEAETLGGEEELAECQSAPNELGSLGQFAVALESGDELGAARREVEMRRRANKKLQKLYFLAAIRLVVALGEIERLKGVKFDYSE